MIKKYHDDKKNLLFRLPLCLLVVLIVSLTPLNAQAGFEESIYKAMLGFFGFFTGLAGVLLNLSIEKLVIGMGDIVPVEVINLSWSVVRDVFNLAFIFGLIYIGIKTIISPDSSGLKRHLALIIIAAILINFSLFITKAVIDVSNMAAVQINSFLVSDSNIHGNNYENTGISGAFMERMGLVGLLTTDEMLKKSDTIDVSDRTWVFALCASVFLLIAAYVFAAGAILLAIRFVALIMLMIASPVMFLGMMFPKLAGNATRWWSMLFSYAFFAPIYLFLLYVSLMVIDEFRNNGLFGENIGHLLYNPSQLEGFEGASSFDVFLGFLLICILMIASLVIAKNTGVAGGNIAVSVLQTAGTRVRQGVQRGAQRGAMWTAGTGSGLKWGVGATSRVSLKKFDTWQAKKTEDQNPGGRALRGALNFTNLDRSLRGTLETGQNVKLGSKYSYKDNQGYAGERETRLANKRVLMDRDATLKEAEVKGVTSEAEVNKLVAALKNITTTEAKDKDNDLDIKLLTKEEVAAHLTVKTVDALEENSKYSREEIQAVRDAREAGIKNTATATGADAKPAVKEALITKRDGDDIAKLPAAVFTHESMAKYLTPEKVEARLKKGNISAVEMKAIGNSLEEYITDPNTPENVTKDWQKWASKSTFGARLELE